jgi:cell division protein FtsW
MEHENQELEKLTKAFWAGLGLLVLVGLIMVLSSSYILAQEVYGNSAHLFVRQLFFVGIALVLALIISRTKITFWIKISPFLAMIASLAIALTFATSWGNSVKGASRWLEIGSFRLQPGEFAKYATLLYSIYFFENFDRLSINLRMFHFVNLFMPMGLLVLQPDFGSFFICFSIIASICYLSSFPRKIFYPTLIGGIIASAAILMAQPYRVRRLLTFLDPWKNPQGSGFQIIQSYLAFANGAVFGTGLGNSNEKLFYLPEAHNDFIFSVIGEELGFAGVLAFILAYMFLILMGFRIALRLRDKKARLLVAGITFTIGIQALVNMGVVLGLLPTKGLNLPFVSSGGSSMIANFIGVGLIMAAVRSCTKDTFTSDNPMGPGLREQTAFGGNSYFRG